LRTLWRDAATAIHPSVVTGVAALDRAHHHAI
jgi:hypothetical protein